MNYLQAKAVLPKDIVKAEKVSSWVRWALKRQMTLNGRTWQRQHEVDYCQDAGVVVNRKVVSELRYAHYVCDQRECNGCGHKYMSDLVRRSLPMATTTDPCSPFEVTRNPYPASEEELKDTVQDTIGVVHAEFLLCPTCSLRVDLLLETARVVAHGRSWEEMRDMLRNEMSDYMGSHQWEDDGHTCSFIHRK